MFITEMELLQARLAAGKRLNDSHILKEFRRVLFRIESERAHV